MTRAITAVGVLLVLVLGALPAAAEVGNTYVTAYSRTKGVQAKAGKFGTEMLLKTKRETQKSRKSKNRVGAAYNQEIQLCKRTYYTTPRGKRWLAAHRRAKHVLLVRRHVAKGKYRVICGKKPMRKTTTKKKGS